MLVRRSLWETVGGFDESSFMYAEDRDLCWRARRAGWSVWFTPEATFVHLGNASAGDRWSVAQRAERVGAAEAAMVRRHLSPRRAAVTLALIRGGLRARAGGARLIARPDAASRFKGALRGFSEPGRGDG
jgi:GT2 family glycosyltransferase